MERRSFFASLAALPVVGALFARPARGHAVVAAARLETRRSPKLRVWTLGSLEHRVFPTDESINRLAGLLGGWDGESDLDLIWGPELSVQQFDLDGGGPSLDAVCRLGGAEAKDVAVGDDGRVTATVLLREPLVRIVRRDG